MLPFFTIFDIPVYTFWLTLTVCFLLFLWMLKKMSHRFWINPTFFLNRIFLYFFTTFVFSRFFYVISQWNDFKFINNLFEFFIMSDYNFSLIGAIFWFFLVLLVNLRFHRLPAWKYVDVVFISFLFISVIWYIWAFFGGQVYGMETHYGIEILYTNPFSPVTYEVPIFPLSLIYALLNFILFCVLYILILFVNIRGLVWYLWLIIFSWFLIVLENFSGKSDYFKDLFGVWFTQIWAIFFIVFSVLSLYTIYRWESKEPERT